MAGKDSHDLIDYGVLRGRRAQSACRRRGLGRWLRRRAPGRRRGCRRLRIAPRGGPGRRADPVGGMRSSRRGSAVRPDPGAARLGSPERAHDQPGGDPPPRQQAGRADRHAVHQPGRTRRSSGVGLLQGDPEGLDAFGGGRFDVVSWDPRGTNASTRVRCFRNQRSEARFWAGASIPTTRAASERFRRKTAALARRCGEVSGWLLPHISTADTARDLDHLRVLLGEEKLTYVGLSYGTFIGQTYANLFPDRVRAMLLNGIVDAPEALEGGRGEVRQRRQLGRRGLRPVPLVVRRRGTGALRARRWRPDRGRAGRAAVRAGEARADPGSGGEPAAVVAPGAELRRSAALAVRAAEGSRAVAGQRGGSRRRAAGRRIGARERGAAASTRPPAGPA